MSQLVPVPSLSPVVTTRPPGASQTAVATSYQPGGPLYGGACQANAPVAPANFRVM